MERNKMYGVVDIGSNTVRFNVYRNDKSKYKVVVGKKSFVGLSAYIRDGAITEAGSERLHKIVARIGTSIRDLDLENFYLFATAAVRNASNGRDIVKSIKKETGLKIEILSGREEAYCDYVGAMDEKNQKIDDALLVDIGGGSTEIIRVKKGVFEDSVSLPEGSLSLYSTHVSTVIPRIEEYREMKSYIGDLIERSRFKACGAREMYGIGGTIRATGEIAYDLFHKGNESVTGLRETENIIRRLLLQDPETLKSQLKVAPERVHTQVPGMIILREVMKKYGMKEINILENGVREGYLIRKKKDKNHA